MKTYELTGAALDWAVAECEELTEHSMGLWKLPILEACTSSQYSPSTNWAQGGPIIERERIDLIPLYDDNEFDVDTWAACATDDDIVIYGTTPLIAAMRCYVASKLGSTVEVPAELLK